MTPLFYSEMCKSCKSVTMEFIFIQFVRVKLARFTLTHTILFIVTTADPFPLNTCVAVLLRCI